MNALVVLWISLSILFSSLGQSRQIGFWGAFFVCILLSPLIGLIVILFSEKHSESLMKLKIAHESGNLSKEEYEEEVRKIVPNKEDKQNMLIGCAVVASIGMLIFLIIRLVI